MEKTHVSGVAQDKNVARVALVGLADQPGIAFKIFFPNSLKKRSWMAWTARSASRSSTRTETLISLVEIMLILSQHRGGQGVYRGRRYGQQRRCGLQDVRGSVFRRILKAIPGWSTSPIRAMRAVQAIHDRFFSEFGNA